MTVYSPILKRETSITLLATAMFSLATSVLLWSIWVTGHLRSTDNAFMDITQRHLSPAPLSDSPLVYIKIGDISDQPWPWPSLEYAILTHSILRYFPKAMAMDIPFFSTSDRPTVYDSQLKKQLARLNQNLVAIPLTASGHHLGTATSLRHFATTPELPNLPFYDSGLWPIEQVTETSTLGPQVFSTDPDGRIRKIPLLVNYQGNPVASHILSTYAAYRGADLPNSGAIMGESILLKDKEGKVIESIPINEKGEITLRYYQELPLRKEVEFYNVILTSEQQHQGDTPDFDLGVFRNSLIILGKEHPDIIEPVKTPHGLMSPARLQLQALSNLIYRSYLSYAPSPVMIILIYLSAAGGILIARLHSPFLSLTGLTAFVVYIGAMVAMFFYFKGYWIEPTALLTAPWLGWLAGRLFTPYLTTKFT